MRELVRLGRPLHLLLSSLSYLLGAGIASYLGAALSSVAFWLGLVWIVLVQMSFTLLAQHFRAVTEPLLDHDSLNQRIRFRYLLLLTASASLTIAVVLALIMLRIGLLTSSTLLFLALIVILLLVYAVPPFRLIHTGFGEFILAILIANLPASLAFLLQTGEYHRLVGFITFPLILLGFAWLIVLDFPSFAQDQKYDHLTLLRRIGWERAVPLHHSLVILAYLTFLLAPFIGIHYSLIWPAYLTLPFALLQILLVRGLALGGRPNWRLLTVTATSVFGLTVYFITLTFWLR